MKKKKNSIAVKIYTGQDSIFYDGRHINNYLFSKANKNESSRWLIRIWSLFNKMILVAQETLSLLFALGV